MQENLSSRFPTRQAQTSLEILLAKRLDMMLSNTAKNIGADAEAGLSHCCLQTKKRGFLRSRPNCQITSVCP